MTNDFSTTIDKYKQTFTIFYGDAFVNGHTSYGGEIFYVFVPPQHRNQGVAKMLLKKAVSVLNERCDCPKPSITSATSKEGAGLVNWFKKELAP